MAEPVHTRHAITISPLNGGQVTLGPDELEAGTVPSDISYNTELPGGYGPANISFPIPRGYIVAQWMLAAIRIYDAATDTTLYEGRITNVTVNEGVVSIQTEGWAKHLFDDETARMVFYDRDLSGWGPPSAGYSLSVEATYQTVGPAVEWDTSAPALSLTFSGPWGSAPTLPFATGWYDAGAGNKVALVDYAWKKNAAVESASASWSWEVGLSSDGLLTSKKASGNLRAAGPGSGTQPDSTTAGGNKRYAYVTHSNTTAGGVAKQYTILWTLLGVVGDHGLTLQGSVSAPNTGRGLLVSDMAAYVAGRWAPLLSATAGLEGSIEPTTFAVPHLAFKEDTTAGAMLESMMLFGGSEAYALEWGVYDGHRLIIKQSNRFGRTWRVRNDQTAKSSDQGADSSERLNGVKVTYDDGTGTKYSVGPPGSGATVETAGLQDTNPANPANQDGARHWKAYDAGVMNEEQAKLVGGLILAEANNIRWRGDVSVTDWVSDETGMHYPAGIVKAGDFFIVEDDPNGDTAPRQIRNTAYSGATRQANCSVGASPDRLDVLLARAGVTLAGRL